MIYLASPFTHPLPGIQTIRQEKAFNFTHRYLQQGYPIFSPIVYSRTLFSMGGLPGDFSFWQAFNEQMIASADSLWVLQIDGWKESRGVQSEIEMAESLNTHIVFLGEDLSEYMSRRRS